MHFVEIGNTWINLEQVTTVRRKGEGVDMILFIHAGEKLLAKFPGKAAMEIYELLRETCKPKVWNVSPETRDIDREFLEG